MKISTIALLLLIASARLDVNAQKTNYVGVNLTLETSGAINLGGGFLFEQRMTKRSSFETGLYYRKYKLDGYVFYSDSTGTRAYPFAISESHLSIPILYKLHTRLLNFSAGPTFDFYLGWKQKNMSSLVKVSNYSFNPTFAFGLMAKANKDFNLNKQQIILAPEVRFNHIISHGRTYIGIGLAAKRQL